MFPEIDLKYKKKCRPADSYCIMHWAAHRRVRERTCKYSNYGKVENASQLSYLAVLSADKLHPLSSGAFHLLSCSDNLRRQV